MRETTFIDRNKERWQEIEQSSNNNPDVIAKNFIELTSDLSYAQTHYPHSKLTSLLNFLAGKMYKSIYHNRKRQPILDYWKHDLPLILGNNQRVLWVAVVLFLAFCALGVLCTFAEPDFIESVLGNSYIEMTNRNIESGKPFGVYSDSEPFMMFLRIFSNNLLVGLLIVVSGVFFGIGTIYHTFTNGVMVGSFFSMFFKHGLGFQALGVINLHGTIELMGLVLECMAGLLLGLSILMPGPLTRKQAFKKGLSESGKIYIGTVPFTCMAAMIESYITRMGEAGMVNSNIWVSIILFTVLIASWVLIVWYFFKYSKKVAAQSNKADYLKWVSNEA